MNILDLELRRLGAALALVALLPFFSGCLQTVPTATKDLLYVPGWTAPPAAERLKIDHEREGPLLDSLELAARPLGGSLVVRTRDVTLNYKTVKGTHTETLQGAIEELRISLPASGSSSYPAALRTLAGEIARFAASRADPSRLSITAPAALLDELHKAATTAAPDLKVQRNATRGDRVELTVLAIEPASRRW